MGSLSTNKFRPCTRRGDISLSDMIVDKSYRNRHLFQVHTDERSTDINTCIRLDFFHCHRIAKCLVSSCRKRTACLWLRNYIYNLCKRNRFPLYNDRSVQVFTALRRNINALSACCLVNALERSLCNIQIGVRSYLVSSDLTC